MWHPMNADACKYTMPEGGQMENEKALDRVLKQLAEDVRLFIELSLQEADASWEEWMGLVSKGATVRCWELKGCGNVDCPAFLNREGRCWLIAGTMCEGKVRGEFALKYKSCTECEVYRQAIFTDPVTEIYEHILTLVHSFRATQSKLKALATKDTLTGLYNRAYFNEVIMNEMQRTKRYGNAFSIVMLDVDGFKWINDCYGHIFGDKVLKDCAEILVKSVRASDVLVRFGGDEFVIVLPEGDGDKCEEMVERIKRNVDEWNMRLASPDYSLSLSAGCATYAQGMEIMSVLKEADDKMYRQKRGPEAPIN